MQQQHKVKKVILLPLQLEKILLFIIGVILISLSGPSVFIFANSVYGEISPTMAITVNESEEKIRILVNIFKIYKNYCRYCVLFLFKL